MKDKTVTGVLSSVLSFVMLSTFFPATLLANSAASSGEIKYLSRGLDNNNAVVDREITLNEGDYTLLSSISNSGTIRLDKGVYVLDKDITFSNRLVAEGSDV